MNIGRRQRHIRRLSRSCVLSGNVLQRADPRPNLRRDRTLRRRHRTAVTRVLPRRTRRRADDAKLRRMAHVRRRQRPPELPAQRLPARQRRHAVQPAGLLAKQREGFRPSRDIAAGDRRADLLAQLRDPSLTAGHRGAQATSERTGQPERQIDRRPDQPFIERPQQTALALGDIRINPGLFQRLVDIGGIAKILAAVPGGLRPLPERPQHTPDRLRRRGERIRIRTRPQHPPGLEALRRRCRARPKHVRDTVVVRRPVAEQIRYARKVSHQCGTPGAAAAGGFTKPLFRSSAAALSYAAGPTPK